MFRKIFYSIAAGGGLFYSFMYLAELLPADNFTLGMYCLGFSFIAFGEALR